MSRQSLGASPVKIGPQGSYVVEVKSPCSIVAASRIPFHHLGLAQGDGIVLHLALPCRKWSEFSSGVGVGGKVATPPKWAHGTF